MPLKCAPSPDLRAIPSPAWGLGPGDAGFEVLNSASALDVLGRALGVGTDDSVDAANDATCSDAVPRILDYIAVNTPQVLMSPAFLSAPQCVVEKVLECPALAIREDDLLEYVLQYAAQRAGADSDIPALWTPAEAAAADPVLQALAPRLAILSLSPAVFVKQVEPLGVFSKSVLTAKYRFDALLAEALAKGELERDMVLAFYGGTSRICGGGPAFVGVPRVRASVVLHESEHPHEIGVEHQLERIAVAGWAGRVAIEFDSRTAIATEASLVFYADREGSVVLADWESIRHCAQPFVLEDNQFWVGFECSVLASKARWGWKFFARGIPDEDS